MEIHKTALIDKSVILGKNIVIGPFTQIMGQVEISDNVKIASNCVVGAEADQPRLERRGSGEGKIIIGEGTTIKDGVIISKPTLTDHTTIGNDCYLMSSAYIAHDCTLDNKVVISHGARLSGYTNIGRYSNIGAGAVTHQKTSIGECVMVGANSFVKGNLLSGLIYVQNNKIIGINKVGIENSNFSDDEKIKLIENANKSIN
jgi:UDP-N-acetylglucosamine acyltransferase|tara:strand:+ start:454 stop:1059 length:606 start_codon:yes stop_codon:yes gene_type:complete